jgi:hypothetical protein
MSLQPHQHRAANHVLELAHETLGALFEENPDKLASFSGVHIGPHVDETAPVQFGLDCQRKDDMLDLSFHILNKTFVPQKDTLKLIHKLAEKEGTVFVKQDAIEVTGDAPLWANSSVNMIHSEGQERVLPTASDSLHRIEIITPLENAGLVRKLAESFLKSHVLGHDAHQTYALYSLADTEVKRVKSVQDTLLVYPHAGSE